MTQALTLNKIKHDSIPEEIQKIIAMSYRSDTADKILQMIVELQKITLRESKVLPWKNQLKVFNRGDCLFTQKHLEDQIGACRGSLKGWLKFLNLLLPFEVKCSQKGGKRIGTWIRWENPEMIFDPEVWDREFQKSAKITNPYETKKS